MAEELTAIERYRANWKPDEAKVAEYKSLYFAAERRGDRMAMVVYFDLWSNAMQPPRHLPIKNLEKTDDSP